MNVATPFAPFLSPATAALLRTLAGTSMPLTGREAARIAEISSSTAWATLARLAEAGLVDEQQAGKATLYLLNREHVAAGPLLDLLRLRERLFEQIRHQVAQWPLQPLHASVYGSGARGDGDSKSDIDLFFVRPDGVESDDEHWRADLDALAEAIRRWSGNQAGITDLDRKQLQLMLAESNPISRNLRRDAVVLAGVPVQELVPA